MDKLPQIYTIISIPKFELLGDRSNVYAIAACTSPIISVYYSGDGGKTRDENLAIFNPNENKLALSESYSKLFDREIDPFELFNIIDIHNGMNEQKLFISFSTKHSLNDDFIEIDKLSRIDYSKIIDDLEEKKIISIQKSEYVLACDTRLFKCSLDRDLEVCKNYYEVDFLGSKLADKETEEIEKLWLEFIG